MLALAIERLVDDAHPAFAEHAPQLEARVPLEQRAPTPSWVAASTSLSLCGLEPRVGNLKPR